MSNFMKVQLDGDHLCGSEGFFQQDFNDKETEEEAQLAVKQFVRRHKDEYHTKVITTYKKLGCKKLEEPKPKKEKKPKEMITVVDKKGNVTTKRK
jgi:hypothetical protein